MPLSNQACIVSIPLADEHSKRKHSQVREFCQYHQKTRNHENPMKRSTIILSHERISTSNRYAYFIYTVCLALLHDYLYTYRQNKCIHHSYCQHQHKAHTPGSSSYHESPSKVCRVHKTPKQRPYDSSSYHENTRAKGI